MLSITERLEKLEADIQELRECQNRVREKLAKLPAPQLPPEDSDSDDHESLIMLTPEQLDRLERECEAMEE